MSWKLGLHRAIYVDSVETEKLPMLFRALFEARDTIIMQRIWDHSAGNCLGPFCGVQSLQASQSRGSMSIALCKAP